MTLEHERCWLHTNTAGEGGQARGGVGGGGGGSGEGRNEERERARYRDRAAERRGLYAASEEGSPNLLAFAGTKISSLLVLKYLSWAARRCDEYRQRQRRLQEQEGMREAKARKREALDAAIAAVDAGCFRLPGALSSMAQLVAAGLAGSTAPPTPGLEA